MAAPLVFLDTETTGTEPGREAWEIGMIRRDPDGAQRETSMFLDVDLAHADPRALPIGRFYERHPFGRSLAGIGPRAPIDLTSGYHAAMTVASYTHGAVVLGCTVNFDTETLDPLLRRHRLIPSWDYHIVDVTTFAAGVLRERARVAGHRWHGAGPDPLTPPYKCRTIAAMLGIEQLADEAHTALGDARLAMLIYDAVTTPAP